MDKIIHATAQSGSVRIIAADTTSLVNEAVKNHNTMPTASAAYGRMLTAGALMGSMLKGKQDSVTIQINGGGISGGVLATGRADGRVKGYIVNPDADLPVNEKGKLDVSGIIGIDGKFTVITDLGMKEPYVSSVPIFTGEIAEDLAYFYTVSEQTPSAVALGVLVDVDGSVMNAGGFIIQMMPGADEMLADLIMYRLEEIPSLTTLQRDGNTIVEIIQYIFDGMGLNILSEGTPELYCDCSKERVEKALISIGKEDLKEIYEDNASEELVCHFCNKKYHFSHEDIGRLLDELQ
ncbi:Hsp33 family molecular chaperone HslO [Proteiniclasticum sp. SCR006]|uniref:33 kDa chaperonin n=1 Tax=Proteiniclasticum aestuarii TaxID=2817862 RepID=A0A939HEU7_9CLOT|nr:Hsp33 family molecular chaperone HslO [Proteiniclasticum aestuarii]MBO1266240.1 Hsp33 family molecular chaperone HslO [Proteiniclasticum aestuarii]